MENGKYGHGKSWKSHGILSRKICGNPVRDGSTDFHEIAYYDGHISRDDARLVGISKF